MAAGARHFQMFSSLVFWPLVCLPALCSPGPFGALGPVWYSLASWSVCPTFVWTQGWAWSVANASLGPFFLWPSSAWCVLCLVLVNSGEPLFWLDWGSSVSIGALSYGVLLGWLHVWCLFWVEINLLSVVCCGGWVVFMDCLLSLSALLWLGWRATGKSLHQLFWCWSLSLSCFSYRVLCCSWYVPFCLWERVLCSDVSFSDSYVLYIVLVVVWLYESVYGQAHATLPTLVVNKVSHVCAFCLYSLRDCGCSFCLMFFMF